LPKSIRRAVASITTQPSDPWTVNFGIATLEEPTDHFIIVKSPERLEGKEFRRDTLIRDYQLLYEDSSIELWTNPLLDAIWRIFTWNSKRYSPPTYNSTFTYQLLNEEFMELVEATNIVDKLDAEADIFYLAIGGFWKQQASAYDTYKAIVTINTAPSAYDGLAVVAYGALLSLITLLGVDTKVPFRHSRAAAIRVIHAV